LFSDLWMSGMEPIEFGKDQWEYLRENGESWSILEEFRSVNKKISVICDYKIDG